jgi:hypothetical protein
MKYRKVFMASAVMCSMMLVVLVGTIGADSNRFPQCDDDGNPWFEEYCVLIEEGIHTTITITKYDSMGAIAKSEGGPSFILFDNILDRDGIIIFTKQPEYWQRRGDHDTSATWNRQDADLNDSTAIWLPFPDIGSGLYVIKLQSGQETYLDTFLIMQ